VTCLRHAFILIIHSDLIHTSNLLGLRSRRSQSLHPSYAQVVIKQCKLLRLAMFYCHGWINWLPSSYQSSRKTPILHSLFTSATYCIHTHNLNNVNRECVMRFITATFLLRYFRVLSTGRPAMVCNQSLLGILTNLFTRQLFKLTHCYGRVLNISYVSVCCMPVLSVSSLASLVEQDTKTWNRRSKHIEGHSAVPIRESAYLVVVCRHPSYVTIIRQKPTFSSHLWTIHVVNRGWIGCTNSHRLDGCL